MSGGGMSRTQDIGHLKNYLPVTVDFSSATWNTVATHELFTVTGLVRVQIIPECTEDLVAGAGGTISLGIEGGTTAMNTATLFSLIDSNDLWLDETTPSPLFSSTELIDKIINNNDIGFEIATNAFTDGTMIFHCWWEPLNQTTPGTVVAGAGGTL